MTKPPKYVKWLSIALGAVAGIATPFVLNIGTGVGLDWYISNGNWVPIALGFVAAFVVFWVFWSLPRLVFRICARVNRSLPQDTRPKLLDVRQRIVVWTVAIALTVICIVHGLLRREYTGWGYSLDLVWRQDSFSWVFIFPVLLIGAATFLHVMRRKE